MRIDPSDTLEIQLSLSALCLDKKHTVRTVSEALIFESLSHGTRLSKIEF
jgi:hypothetical protein